jgi:hypothetical protein
MKHKKVSIPQVLSPFVFLVCGLVILGCCGRAWADNPVQSENLLLGTLEWQLTNPATPGWPTNQDALFPEIEGYASATSVNTNQTIEFFVDVRDPLRDPSYSLEIFRMGWYDGRGARRVWWEDQSKLVDRVALMSRKQLIPVPDPVSGFVECDWVSSYTLQVPSTWVSGVYVGKLTATGSGKQSYIIFVVRQDARSSDLLFQSSVTTFQAYNPWGGKSLYPYPSTKALQVSFNRPYAGACYPFGIPADSNSVPRQDLRFGTGAGEFFATIGANPRPGWEYNMVRWLERQGFDVTYCTSIDTHTRAGLRWSRKQFKAFLCVGHDEYWSAEMRSNVEAARDRGVHLGFFSANVCYWRAHFDPTSRRMTVRKENPLNFDLWRGPQSKAPEVSLVGVSYIYNTLDVDMMLPETLPQHWIYDHTGLKPLDRLPGLLGYELDGELDVYPNRLETTRPVPPAGTLRLMSTVFTNKALNITGKSYATYYEAPSGAQVFASGSMQWSWGLDDYNAFAVAGRESRLSPPAQQMTYNVLSRFVAPTNSPRRIAFVNADTTTGGDWKSRYGIDGSCVAAGAPLDPNGTAWSSPIRIEGSTPLLWSSNSVDPRALLRPERSRDRVAAAFAARGSFAIEAGFPDSTTRIFSLYCVDWLGAGWSQRVEMYDPADPLAVLDVRDFQVPTNGAYLVWSIQGRKGFRIINTSSSPDSVAVVSGAFLGGGGSARFHQADIGTESSGTGGDWITGAGVRRYGREGYHLVDGPYQHPASLELNPIGVSTSRWRFAAMPSRGLRMVDSGGRPMGTRIAASWNSPRPSFSVDVAFNDDKPHQVSLYFLDWDGCSGSFPARQQTVEVISPVSGDRFDLRSVAEVGSNFCNGTYLSWLVRGRVRFRIASKIPSVRPVLSGLFFDPDPHPVCTIAPLPPIAHHIRVDLGWDAIVGETYRVESTQTLAGSPWTVLLDRIVAVASQEERIIEAPADSASRFYRVVLDRD